MDLQELTARMKAPVEVKGWDRPKSVRPQTGRNLAISLVLESSEVLEHFQWSETSSKPDELAGELADVALYLLQLASVTGIDLENAILQKLDQNHHRVWDHSITEVKAK